QPLQCGLITEDAPPEFGTIDHAILDDARKRRANLRDHRTVLAQQAVHLGIGIVNRDAESPQLLGCGGFAHADRSREAQYDHPAFCHRRIQPNDSSTNRRSSGVTSGSMPNQAAKPGRAWCSSIPRPSTTRLPRALAALSSAVSNGE